MTKLGVEWVNVSVSHGTLRAEDLIPAFDAVLRTHGVMVEQPECVTRLLEGGELTDDEWEQVSWFVNEDLFDAMDEIAPEGCYFGAHPGDGADYGFWSAEDE